MSLRIVTGNASSAARTLPNETDLIAAAREGDTNAFQQLYEHYRDRIFNLIYYSLRESQQAEDILQTVFLKVFQALPFFRAESSFLTWVYRVTLNECKNVKIRRRFWVPLSEIFDRPEERDPRPSSEMIHSSAVRAQALQEALMKLKPKHREVVVLKYLEELSYEEIAVILGVSTGTIASRLHRAMENLSSLLR